MSLAARRRYTGPERAVVELIGARSSGWCEFPNCGQPANDPHHRVERKAGGRGPKGPDWLNLPSNLLAACRHHNDWCSNQQPREAQHMGWIVRHPDLPWLVPVQTIHDPLPVFLDDEGGWRVMEISQ